MSRPSPGGAHRTALVILASCLARPAASQDAPQPRASEADLAVRAIERANLHRKNAGLQPVALDSGLSRGCKAHAEYLVLNADAPQTQGLGAHDEDTTLPGYTEAGKKAGKSSDINFVEPVASVEGWMNSLFHRVPLLAPDLVRVGVGFARGGRTGWVTVMDVTSGKGSVKIRPRVVLYPADKQKDVPPEFTGEIPDPIPADPDRRAGYPITATFEPGLSVKTPKATLEDDSGKSLEFWLSSPSAPAHATYQRNTVCLFPKEPLEPRKTYTVTVEAKLGAKPWRATWSFTTGETTRPQAPGDPAGVK